MEQRVLGRTGLRVSVMGLGCGGHSRAGQGTGGSEAHSIGIIRQALDRGVNLIDTAESYGTEEIVGKAIKDVRRDSVIISTKKTTKKGITQGDVEKSIEGSLHRLGTDYIDLYHLHGVDLKDYGYFTSEIVPVLDKMRTRGKIRFIGVTEPFIRDPGHAMLKRAVQDDFWDVIMVGFNMLNSSARDRVLKRAAEKNVGVLIMYAVRLAFSKPERLRQIVEDLIKKKEVDPSKINRNDPLGFLIHEGGAVSLADAAYRFCRHEPGTQVILAGTGNPEHLKENIESFSRPPLPRADLERLAEIFGRVDSVSGE